ncbi:MAG: hypothetical protein RL326_2193 [Pseudomonadota bacterium]
MKIHTAANVLDLDPQQFDSPSPHSEYSGPDQRRRRKRQPSGKRDLSDAYEMRDINAAEDSIDYISPATGVKFCSRSEAICAELLRRYVPHFELREGLTFQVPIGRDQRGNVLAVDFLVDGVLFEYHPVRLFKNRRRFGDFLSKQEYRAYVDVCHSLTRDQREFFQDSVKARLTKNYFTKRRALLDQHPTYRRMELVVASSPEEFYALILKRFGKNVPRSVERFMAIFDELRVSLPE